MHFTVLYPGGEKWEAIKKIALEAAVQGSSKDAEARSLLDPMYYENYLVVKRNYARVAEQVERGEVYDFYRLRRKFRRVPHALSEFNRFRVLATLGTDGPWYVFRDGCYEEMGGDAGHTRCPFCNEDLPSQELGGHLKAGCGTETQIESGSKVTVVFDRGIQTEYESLVLDCTSVRMLKKAVYDRTGISVNKQEVYRGSTVLKNTDTLHGETVVLKQKKREQRR